MRMKAVATSSQTKKLMSAMVLEGGTVGVGTGRRQEVVRYGRPIRTALNGTVVNPPA